LSELLGGHLAARHLTAADGTALVFVGSESGPLGYSTWRTRVWVPACVDAGLGELHVDGRSTKYRGLGFHDLRRTAATALVVEGVDIKTAQARLGHSDPRLTLGLYAQVVTEADRSAAERVGERLLRSGRANRADRAGWTRDEAEEPVPLDQRNRPCTASLGWR
jgi:integrase